METKTIEKVIERKDAWTPEMDQILLDCVLERISNGSTQMAGFEQAAQKIGKSKSACAFRFNAVIRKEASEQIEQAKEKSKKKNKTNIKTEPISSEEVIQTLNEVNQKKESNPEVPSLDQVISLLNSMKETATIEAQNTKIKQMESLVSDAMEQLNVLKSALENIQKLLKS